ncbi:MAG: DUF4912 domain-containing protein [Betaproteobacteria bacterium]
MASSKKTAARKARSARDSAAAPPRRKSAARTSAKKKTAARKRTAAKALATPPEAAAARGRRASRAKPAAGAKPKAAPLARARRRPARARAAAEQVRATLQDVGGPSAVPGLSEEDQIRAAKYLPRELSKRVFEEERFLFPETYGLNRIRLLVRDPDWIFAYWDVNPEAMKDLGRRLGERTLALSRLTLRVVDPVSGASSDILLPPGARWWYVRTDSARRTYRAELGVTLPSGEFRRLAESNTVVTPRVGPSSEGARRRMSYPASRELPLSAAEAALAADLRSGVAQEPWAPGAVGGAAEPAQGDASGRGQGGASDTFRSGASDAFRR